MIYVEENDYHINIVEDSSKELMAYLNEYKGNKIALFSDNHVFDIYGDVVKGFLQSYNIYPFTFPVGEASKSMEMYYRALEFLSENNFNRSDLIIAFGGGVTGDLAGFVASSYLRGLDYINVPTSLMAMVDSSVGGKTGINFNKKKNQIGSFYFPKYVHIDYMFLKTLNERDYKAGLAEIFKYAILCDKDLFNRLNSYEDLDIGKIIQRSLEIKLDYVKGDEKDRGKRQFLNLGHTLGHAIESISNYDLLHGEAVGIGLIDMSKLSYKLGFTDDDFSEEIKSAFNKYDMIASYVYSPQEVIQYIKYDKKIRGEEINLIFPIEIGSAISKKVKLDGFEEMLKLL